MFRALLAILIVMISVKVFSLGKPLVPSSSEQIIVTLKNNNISPLIDSMREQLKKNPQDERVANHLITSYLRLSKLTGDERYLGYAMAIINHWPPELAPENILLLKARVIQRQHHFFEALDILSQVVKKNPKSGEAYLLFAYIYMAQGELELAGLACRHARPWLIAKENLNCSSRVLGLSGEGEKAYQLLQVILARSAGLTDSIQPHLADRESYVNLAEIATRLGKDKEAERFYRFAIASINMKPKIFDYPIVNSLAKNFSRPENLGVDPQTVSGLADILLAQERYQECIDLIQGEQRQRSYTLVSKQVLTPLAKIQLVLAKSALEKNSDREREQLKRYFELEQLRNQDYSSRDFARYLLEIEKDAEQAFVVARESWKSQREPDDLLVLLNSARAAEKHRHISDVFLWREQSGLEDVRVDRILSQPW